MDDAIDFLYRQLSSRQRPLYVHINEPHQNAIVSTYQKITESLNEANAAGWVYSSVKRSALMAFRLVGLFTIFRPHQQGKYLSSDRLKSVWINADDLKAALVLAVTYLDHSVRLFEGQKPDTKSPLDTTVKRAFYNQLPERNEGVWRTGTAYSIMENRMPESYQKSDRTIRRWLAQ